MVVTELSYDNAEIFIDCSLQDVFDLTLRAACRTVHMNGEHDIFVRIRIKYGLTL